MVEVFRVEAGAHKGQEEAGGLKWTKSASKGARESYLRQSEREERRRDER